MEMRVVDVRLETPVRGWVEEDLSRILLEIGEHPGKVLLGLSERGAHDLVDVIKRELKALCPPGPGEPTCEICCDTGDLWVPIGLGAVARRECECQWERSE